MAAAGVAATARPVRAARALACALLLAAGAAGAQTPVALPEPTPVARPWWSRFSLSLPNPFARAARPQPPTGVQDPHYGDSLFYFYQGRYFSALTTLMVSQHFDRMPVHRDEAEVLRGGLFLSYGMHREAGEIFEQLIARNAPPAVRDRAWYYLAKIRYQRGLLAEAVDAMGRIEGVLPAELEEDRALLQSYLLLAQGDNAGAVRVLERIAAGSNASWYARYNLGVALVRSGDAQRGIALLDAIGQATVSGEELRSLRDRANVALGFAALQANDAARAQQVLERVRLQGMLANKALLGFGWAAAAQKQLSVALVPWTELAGRDPGDSAVLEAKLAVPFAFAELGAYAQALTHYQDAIAAFDRESARLDESIAAIRAGRLLAGLIERNPGEEMGWFWNIGELPDLPHGAHLAPILAEHEFQEAFKNWRDLLFLERNLTQWQQSIGALRDMLDNRRQAFAERLPAVREKNRALDLDAADRERQALRAELAGAEQAGDVAALADARERALAGLIAQARATVDDNPGDPQIVAARERLRRVAGALLWEQTQQFAPRLHAARRALDEIDRNLAEAQARDRALAAAQREEPARLDAFAARIDALQARLQALQPRVAALAAEQQAALQALAVAVLERQKERLAAHGAQARFAVAQLYDRASVGRGEPHATAQ